MSGGPGHHRAADDERLLVRQGEPAARGERSQRRFEAGGALQAVQHDVGAAAGHLGRRARPGEDLDAAGASTIQRGLDRRHALGTGDRHGPDAQPDRLLGQEIGAAALRGQRDDPEAAGVALDDVDRLRSD
jgi:hypothetical protein